MAKASAKKSAAPKLARDGTRRGGARIDPATGKSLAGRKKRVETEPTSLTALDVAACTSEPAPDEIDGVAQRHAHTALAGLLRIALYGSSESARIACCNEILDRGYGKPAVEIGGDAASPMLPLMLAPDAAANAAATAGLTAQIRTEARKHALLVIEVLSRIATAGKSETARAAANKSLLVRGLGTVASARMPEEMSKQPVGKKEERARAAEIAATGKFATPAPPRQQTLQ